MFFKFFLDVKKSFKSYLETDSFYFEDVTYNINKKYNSNFLNVEESLFNDNIPENEKIKLQNIYNVLKVVVDLMKFQDENELQVYDEIDFYIKSRKHRAFIKNSFKIRKFLIGDILEFVYNYKNMALTFNGICISLRKKSFVMPDQALILRNVIIGTGIEVTLSYFYNKGYKMQFLDYRRKFFSFNKNKLFFIRDRVNRESKV